MVSVAKAISAQSGHDMRLTHRSGWHGPSFFPPLFALRLQADQHPIFPHNNLIKIPVSLFEFSIWKNCKKCRKQLSHSNTGIRAISSIPEKFTKKWMNYSNPQRVFYILWIQWSREITGCLMATFWYTFHL